MLSRESFFSITNMTSPNLCVKLQRNQQYEKTCGPQGIV